MGIISKLVKKMTLKLTGRNGSVLMMAERKPDQMMNNSTNARQYEEY